MGTDGRGGSYPDNTETAGISQESSAYTGSLGGQTLSRRARKNTTGTAGSNISAESSSLDRSDGNSFTGDSQNEQYPDDENKSYSLGASLRRNASTRIKQVSQGLKRITSIKDNNNKSQNTTTPSQFSRTKSASAAQALEGLHFISQTNNQDTWLAMEKKFNEQTMSTNGVLHRSHFCHCVGMGTTQEFALKLFDALARRRLIRGDSITKDDLRYFWADMSDGNFNSRLQIFFDMLDKDADGKITQEEITEVINLSASANKLSNIQKQADEYAALIMEELDPHHHGYILIENLKTLLLEAPDLPTSEEESKNMSDMLNQKLKPTKAECSPTKMWYRKSMYLFLDNWQKIWVMALWLAIVLGLFTYKFVQYRNRVIYNIMGYCICTAKGTAETLKFNMALILLPVCRNTLTWFRNKTKLGVAVPFDDNINFHKVIAVAIAIGAALHTGAHLTCDYHVLHASEDDYALMKPYFGDNQPTNYWWFVKRTEGATGVEMIVLMAIAFTLASPWFMRNKVQLPKPFKSLTDFKMFWYSHHLFVIVYVLLVMHSKHWYKKTTWMYLAFPVTLYACERLIRAFRSSIESVNILKIALYPERVFELQLSKPQGFKYMSGQYMFLKCSVVSPFEWHPFSITSAPDDDYLSVHIRCVGDWTEQLHAVLSEMCPSPTGEKNEMRIANFTERGNCSQIDPPRVLIDGPYGASSQEYQKYEVVLLVGLGIGATPMISILKDIVYKMKAQEEEEPVTSPGRRSINKRSEGFKTKKAYFYWVTKEPASLDWFKGVIAEVAEMDQDGVIELHNYCSRVYAESDARSALIAMVQSIKHAKHGVDIVSGTRVKTHFARPNWPNVYNGIALNHKGARVGVFFCGMPALGAELHNLSRDFSHNNTTKFDFHKENF